jgi:hypothetical protein
VSSGRCAPSTNTSSSTTASGGGERRLEGHAAHQRLLAVLEELANAVALAADERGSAVSDGHPSGVVT